MTHSHWDPSILELDWKWSVMGLNWKVSKSVSINRIYSLNYKPSNTNKSTRGDFSRGDSTFCISYQKKVISNIAHLSLCSKWDLPSTSSIQKLPLHRTISQGCPIFPSTKGDYPRKGRHPFNIDLIPIRELRVFPNKFNIWTRTSIWTNV